MHDPLCPSLSEGIDPGIPGPCTCYLIAKVRTDERERIAQAIEDEAGSSDGGYEDGLWWAAQVARQLGSRPVDNEPDHD